MLIATEELSDHLNRNSRLGLGCIVDTNVLFAASFPLDTHNEWAESVFVELRTLQIPVFTNINIRSEFIDLNRRVLIPEGLVSFYDEMTGLLNSHTEQSLKSLKTRKDKSAKDNRTFKLSDSDIKNYRRLLSAPGSAGQANGWELFCAQYLHPYIKTVWDRAIAALDIQFIGTRAIDNKDVMDSDPTWEGMLDILGKSGIGSSDAMIVNLFSGAKLPLIITADTDVRDTVLALGSPGKYVLAPR